MVVVVVVVVYVPLFLANFPEGLLLPRRPLMVRAALLRRSCDGAGLGSSLRVASATELMLLRRG